MEELRERCLELALRTMGVAGNADPKSVIHAAEQYVQFITGSAVPQTDGERAALKSLGFV